MAIQIGAPAPPETLIELLTDCHGKIRRHLALADEAASRADLPADRIVEACRRVEGYFREALPRHVADEEESLLPRLRGAAGPELDAALASMHRQHGTHEAQVEALLQALPAVCADPAEPTARRRLAAAVGELREAFDPHLVLEEAVIFPAIERHLSAVAQAEILAEIRARRARPCA